MNDPFMNRAIELALANVKEGGQPFGAVLVKDNEIIAEGINEYHLKHDVTGHAEMVAIKKAQEKLKTHNLSGFTMYASGEPCPMCLSAMYFTEIENIYYCQSIEEASEIGLTRSSFIYDELKKDKENRSVKMIRIPLTDNYEDPMKKWNDMK